MPFNYQQYHQQLISDLLEHCRQQAPFNAEQANEADQNLLAALVSLSSKDSTDEDYKYLGQTTLSKLIGDHPYITPTINRDLLWYFGGDCLHFMPDQELECYQQLDEALFAGHSEPENEDYHQLKARIFKLH